MAKKPPKNVGTEARLERARQNAEAFVADLALDNPPVTLKVAHPAPDDHGYYSFYLVRGKRSVDFAVLPWKLEHLRGDHTTTRVYVDGNSWSWTLKNELALRIAREALADPDRTRERAAKKAEAAADALMDKTDGRCPTCGTVLEKHGVGSLTPGVAYYSDDILEPEFPDDYKVVCLTCTPLTRTELRRVGYPSEVISEAVAKTVLHERITYQVMPHEVLGAEDFVDPDTGDPDPEACCPYGFRSHDGRGQCIRRYKHPGEHAFRRKEISRVLVDPTVVRNSVA